MNSEVLKEDSELTKFLEEYRNRIIYQRFQLKNLEESRYFSLIEIEIIENAWMAADKLQDLIENSLKLHFIYDALKQALLSAKEEINGCFKVVSIIRILTKGEFYRFLSQKISSLKLFLNNRNTAINTNVLFILYRKEEISTIWTLFELEEALYGSNRKGLPCDAHKILKTLRKMDRVVEPLEFKIWFADIKNAKKMNIELYDFLILASISKYKAQGFSAKILNRHKEFSTNNNPTIILNHSNVNLSPKEEKICVKGLIFCEAPKKRENIYIKIKRTISEGNFRSDSIASAALKQELLTEVKSDKIKKILARNKLRIQSAGFKKGEVNLHYESNPIYKNEHNFKKNNKELQKKSRLTLFTSSKVHI